MSSYLQKPNRKVGRSKKQIEAQNESGAHRIHPKRRNEDEKNHGHARRERHSSRTCDRISFRVHDQIQPTRSPRRRPSQLGKGRTDQGARQRYRSMHLVARRFGVEYGVSGTFQANLRKPNLYRAERIERLEVLYRELDRKKNRR